MEMIRRFEPVALLVIVLGALNWGMVGLFDTNVISDVFGGGTLIFNEFGVLKYHIVNHLKSPRQKRRLETLAELGQLLFGPRQPFALAHMRAGGLEIGENGGVL